MLESTPTDGTDVERFADGNDNSVRGFEIIDEAKTRIEAVCPGAVSCADIIAVAARDSSVIVRKLFLQSRVVFLAWLDPWSSLSARRIVLSGTNRKVRWKSFQQDAQSLGGHTIGRTKCRFFENRLYNFTGGLPDPRLNAEYAAALRRICTPQGADPSPTVALDRNSEFSFDNAYFRNLVANNGVLNSDHVLVESSETSGLVRFLAQDPNLFKVLFAESMINMGNAAWKTRANGEIRRKCSAVNTRLTTEVGHIAAV
ncbi:peroxidase 62 [Selaginella moellendorffii]|uniref:peroxidase 62 n=1 Tax=Selaginella moellendorffii TaxID=88036 RepID=UPI000D1C9E09|nr:peroxidase 62 [Selaginella moellendorffii]|eukprot:XP_024530851.1 peroxidase 62 [Selaginella moellendorffii]